MNIKISTMVLTSLLAGCVGNFTADRQEMYRLGDGRGTIGCTYDPDLDFCASPGTFASLYFGCSDQQFDCVFDGFNVMAVPKGDLIAGQTYTVFGAMLTVERCFGEKLSCDIAMISSICSDDTVCSCRRADVGRIKMKFYFSRELGITAFFPEATGTADDLARLGTDASELNDETPLRTFVLVAEKGFLRAPLNLSVSKLMMNCEDGSTSAG